VKSFRLMGIPLQSVTQAEALSLVRSWLDTPAGQHSIYTPNPEILWNARRDEAVRQALLAGDLLVPDGIGIVLAARLQGEKEVHRLPGIELAEAIIRQLQPRLFLLGARPGVARRAGTKMEEWGAEVVGARHGYFSASEVDQVAREVNQSHAQILLVALGSPRQEAFLGVMRSRLRVPVTMVVGGAFDVWAGDKRRAPRLVRQLGIEWVWRTLHEPRRLLRLVALVGFVWTMAFRRGHNDADPAGEAKRNRE
jgi:N-acetylglucosaminyldiphosphoundecaprenol N-acetyl-beta-D-mannosaminyltransferase